MSFEMIQKLVTTWRRARQIACGMEHVLGTTIDCMYEVNGNILDVLRDYAFEEGDIETSEIVKMAEAGKCNAEIATFICSRHDRTLADRSPSVQQPAPKFFTDEQIAIMQATFGGYTYDAK